MLQDNLEEKRKASKQRKKAKKKKKSAKSSTFHLQPGCPQCLCGIDI